MLDTILKITDIAVKIAGLAVKIVDILYRKKDRHQKNNRDSAK